MPAAEDRTMLEEMAERLGLEDADRDDFINSSMKRMGYKPRMDWDDPDPADNNDKGGDGDFFSRRRGQQQQRQSRDVSGGRQRPDDRGRRAGGYDY